VGAGREEMSEISLAERQEVVRTIEVAWADAQYPGNNKIALHPESNIDEVIKIKHGFTGKHWKEITLETLIANRDCLPWFTIEGMHFYLPAYMIASILHYETVDVLSSNTVYQFSPPDYESSQEVLHYLGVLVTEEVFREWVVNFNRLVDGFSAQQKAAIRAFLELYEKFDYYGFEFDPTGLRALNYWRRYG
jgi:hypothetical protein